LELLGISGNGYEFKLVKISVYIDPQDYSNQMRLVIKVIFESEENFSNPIEIYFKSDQEIKIENEDILDRSQRVADKTYMKRIGADREKKASIPLVIKDISSQEIEKGIILIRIIPDSEKMSNSTIEENKKKSGVMSGFIIDNIIENEGIEKESLWRRLSGWSRFAWKFHFKVWNMAEEMEAGVIPPLWEEGKLSATDEVQIFLTIPKSLVESYGQIVTHPGGDTVHITTKRDKNTFLLSETEEKTQDRIKKWVEEKAMTISWQYGPTASMSREAIVEHRGAHPRFWTFVTFVALVLILGVNASPEVFPLSEFRENAYFWNILMILFVLSYFYTNLYNFSFYDLKKWTNLRFFLIFLRISIISIIVISISISGIENFLERVGSRNAALLGIIAFVFAGLLTYFIEKEKIKRGHIVIQENRITSYLFLKIFIQIAVACFVAVLIGWLFPSKIVSFPLLFMYAYGIATIEETGEGSIGSILRWPLI